MSDAVVASISCQELHQLSLRQPVELIDVREPEEYQRVHAAGACNIPNDKLNPRDVMRSRKLRPEEPVYFICGIGIRSGNTCEAFIDAGFKNVVNVDGGTKAWIEAALPIEHGE